jgi:hypothetical protein
LVVKSSFQGQSQKDHQNQETLETQKLILAVSDSFGPKIAHLPSPFAKVLKLYSSSLCFLLRSASLARQCDKLTAALPSNLSGCCHPLLGEAPDQPTGGDGVPTAKLDYRRALPPPTPYGPGWRLGTLRAKTKTKS